MAALPHLPGVRQDPGQRANAGRAGRLRPSSSRAETYFRGSTRELPFGAFPVVGGFPLVSLTTTACRIRGTGRS